MKSHLLPQIIEGCRRHERAFQKELYHLFYQYTLVVALRYVSSMEDAREIVNDVFLKIFSQIDHYHPELPFKPWLNRITVFTAIDYYRKNIKQHPHTEELETAVDLGASANIIAQISSEELHGLVQQLPHSYRTVINLYAVDGLTHNEIAALLGISVGTSKSNLFKARAKLKNLLLQQGVIKEHNN